MFDEHQYTWVTKLDQYRNKATVSRFGVQYEGDNTPFGCAGVGVPTLYWASSGAKVGDVIAIRIKSIQVTSITTSSGNDQTVEGISRDGTDWYHPFTTVT